MTFSKLVAQFIEIINAAIPFVFALTIVVIMWKIAEAWIFSGGDATKIEQGKKTVLIGVIVLTIMSSLWGVLALLRDSLL